ncbi:unnamed protein product [Clonostachys chloroleuca]|uniref:Uncharacterized protein n=1 Tax=Clonostachys chloroleuca TaxID=1926264 RepID=A0AA35Q818_9HYPO|nr:unnamed protein product [Clonostachys chloroleuca]
MESKADVLLAFYPPVDYGRVLFFGQATEANQALRDQKAILKTQKTTAKEHNIIHKKELDQLKEIAAWSEILADFALLEAEADEALRLELLANEPT